MKRKKKRQNVDNLLKDCLRMALWDHFKVVIYTTQIVFHSLEML
jgi:hypothetical protein